MDALGPPTEIGIVAQCFVGKNDIAALMVERGQACAWVKFPGEHYSQMGQRALCR
jgi:endonuclease YncB( thermonuclease family)